MNVAEERQEGVLVVAPVGRVDSGSSPELERVLLARIETGECRIVVDLGGVEYLSSAGLRVLLMAAKRLRDGGGLVLCALPESVRMVFELAGFLPFFTIEATRETALARVGAPGA